MSGNYKTVLAVVTILLIPALIAGAFGQGGTGKDTTPKNKPANTAPGSKQSGATGTRPKASATKSKPSQTSTSVKRKPNFITAPSGIDLVWISPGSFQMGSDRGINEGPVHQVTFVVDEVESARARFELPKAETDFQAARRELDRAGKLFEAKALSKEDHEAAIRKYAMAKMYLDSQRPTTGEYGFYLGRFEVTQAQWVAVMGSNPSYFKDCATCPVEQVSWIDAQEFLDKLNDRNDGFHYRLPTEAEWEYACRAQTTGDYAGSLNAMGWYLKNSGLTTHPVGQKAPNAFGLYDMHGSVWEWCLDAYHDDYKNAPGNGLAWIADLTTAGWVLRGGSWTEPDTVARSSARWHQGNFRRLPGLYHHNVGFRVAATARTP